MWIMVHNAFNNTGRSGDGLRCLIAAGTSLCEPHNTMWVGKAKSRSSARAANMLNH